MGEWLKMLFGKKNKIMDENLKKFDIIKKQLSDELKIAIGYRNIESFMKLMKMVDHRQITDILDMKITELPDRKFLRRIAQNSSGMVTYLRLYEICSYSEKDPEEDRTWKTWIPKKGDIVRADLGMGYDSIQGGQRPILIVGNDLGLKYSDILFGIPVSSKKKGNDKMHVRISKEYGLREDSFALCEQTRVMSKRSFFFNGNPWKICTLDEQKLQKVYNILEFQLGIKDLNFDPNKAFEMINQMKLLKRNIKIKESKDLIQLFNEKVKEFINYCKNYNINHEDVMKEYKNINNYAVQAI